MKIAIFEKGKAISVSALQNKVSRELDLGRLGKFANFLEEIIEPVGVLSRAQKGIDRGDKLDGEGRGVGARERERERVESQC